MDYQIVFEKAKETQNTVVFKEKPEKGKPPVVGTLYVQKWAAEDVDRVEVTLSIGGKAKTKRAAA